MNVPPCFQEPEARRLISNLCEQNKIDTTLLKDLCEILVNFSGSGRKEGIQADLTDCIDRFIIRSEG